MIETSPSTPARGDVVLPCLDEAGALPWVLDRIPAGRRVIVVDNGSADGSADIARDLGAYVVPESGRGFGAACHAGLTAATADVVRFCDGDASLDPALLPMSTDRFGAIQWSRLAEAGRAVADLPVLRDVDTAADAAQVAVCCPPGSRFTTALAPLAEVAR
ncbi:glycosyltransferase [Streptomyces sp. NBC_00487]|nr:MULTISPECIES: glycosyltransferase [unclassified Streptomyces]